jgi:hypothetical protein
LRVPHQSPVKVERDKISPEYGSLGEVSCATTHVLREIPSRNMTVTIVVDLFMVLREARV